MNTITLKRFAETLDYLIDNNKKEVDLGHTPIAVCVEGEAGVGKTQICERVAKEKGMTLIKKNLSQIEEPADLLGFPYKEYKVINSKGEEEWVSSDMLSSMSNYKSTNISRMAYAVPAWVPTEYNPNGTMLLLDDFSRANGLIIQAIMELINTGSFMTWSLPKYTNVVLTSNPDNGSYNVSSLDTAVQSRMLTFNVSFDVKDWAVWAEEFGLDNRAINFALMYADEIFEPKNNVTLSNARSYTTFCRAIAGIPNWDSIQSKARILEIASSPFNGKDDIIGPMFTRFINEKLDKLITPKELLTEDWDKIQKKVQDSVWNGDKYRSDIASLLGTRMLNYTIKNLNKKGEDGIKAKDFADRMDLYYKDFKENDRRLFSDDILFYIVSQVAALPGLPLSKYFIDHEIIKLANPN